MSNNKWLVQLNMVKPYKGIRLNYERYRLGKYMQWNLKWMRQETKLYVKYEPNL